MTRSSAGQEFVLQGEYAVARGHRLMARYQLKRKENGDAMEQHHRAKLQWTAEPSDYLCCQTAASLHCVSGNNGVVLTQGIRGSVTKWGLSLNGQLGWFRTDNYSSRIYVYHPSLYSSVSSASYYGHGVLAVLAGRWKEKSGRWMVEARYGLVRYFDRDEQGSGLQTIFSPWRNDLSVQLRIRL